MWAFEPHQNSKKAEGRTYLGLSGAPTEHIPGTLALHPPPRCWAQRSYTGLGRVLNGFEQGLDLNLQARRQGVEHGQCWIGQARFNSTHVGAKHIAAVGKVLLRHGSGRAQLLDPFAKRLTLFLSSGCHPPTVVFVYSNIHTLIHTFCGVSRDLWGVQCWTCLVSI